MADEQIPEDPMQDNAEVMEPSQTMAAAEFDDLVEDPGAGAGAIANSSQPKLDVILDIPVTISMEIGRTSISIKELLRLNKGSVVELDRIAGDPLDIMVNGTLIARGEVVVVNEKFGMRLTEVITPSERIKQLS